MTACPHGRSPFATCSNCGRWWTEEQLTKMCELFAARAHEDARYAAMDSGYQGTRADLRAEVDREIAELVAEAHKAR